MPTTLRPASTVSTNWQCYNYFPARQHPARVLPPQQKGSNPGDAVQVLLNEQEARLPFKTKTWPYYRWSDLRDYYYRKAHTPSTGPSPHPHPDGSQSLPQFLPVEVATEDKRISEGDCGRMRNQEEYHLQSGLDTHAKYLTAALLTSTTRRRCSLTTFWRLTARTTVL